MIFVDSGALLARYIKRDQYHIPAIECWHEHERKRSDLVTSSFVVDETLTLLARRTTYAFAAGRASSLYASKVLRILRPTQADELDAISYFGKFADQKVSFTDCVSFALMKRHGIREAFAFDRHFALAGFKLTCEFVPAAILRQNPRRNDQPESADFDALVANLIEQGIAAAGPQADNLSASIVNRVEKELILHVLADCDNVQTKAADRLGINRNTLRKKLEEYGLERP